MKVTVRQTFSLLLAAVTLCACSRSSLEHNNGVVISAEFSADSGNESYLESEVSDLPLWIFDASDGKLFDHTRWEDPRELASNIFNMPGGKYTVVLGACISSPLSADGIASPSEISFILDGVREAQSYSACGDFSIDNPTRLMEVRMEMQSFLSEFAVQIEGAPDGLKLDIEAVNSSAAFYPARKSDDGSFGVQSESLKPTTIPTIGLSAAAPRSQSFFLMPTALGRQWSFWRLVMTTPEGKMLESYIEAPVMKSGEKYLMSLGYNDIQSFMHLSSCPIEDWTQGWVYEGVITDPESE